MTNYELVIKEHQPSCGGKSPTQATIKTVCIDDPLEYVKSLDHEGEPEVSRAEDDTLIITTKRNGWTVSYEFTED